MAEPFLSEIRLFSFGFVPRGWATCDGQLLPINQNQALFSLLGTTYGGNGSTNFALPDLRGRTPIHEQAGVVDLGVAGGAASHAVTTRELPPHSHVLSASRARANSASPAGRVFAASSGGYNDPVQLTSLHPGSISPTGGGQAHENMQPFLTVTFGIALQGVFPSPN